MGTPSESDRVEIVSWLGELLQKVHLGLFSHCSSAHRLAEKESNVGLECKVPESFRSIKESHYEGASQQFLASASLMRCRPMQAISPLEEY